MYDKRVTEYNLNLHASAWKTLPTYHTVYETEQYSEWINATCQCTDEKTGDKYFDNSLLLPEQKLWIQNERRLCRFDFHYLINNYIWITDETGSLCRFIPRIPQKMFLDFFAENEYEGIALLFQVLKARQLGVSRVTSLAILHRVLFYPNVNAVIASSRPSSTTKLADMFEFAYQRVPWWLKPTETANRDASRMAGLGEWIEFGKLDSGITLQHGSQATDIARGTTPNVVHLSELCEFEIDPEGLVDSGLLRAMHDSPRTLLILESTALGQDNWWHNKWQSSKEGWPERRSRLRPIFLPWFCGTDLYPRETWLKAHPIPDNYEFPQWVTDHAIRARSYVQSDPWLKRYMGDWTMPDAQKWYYELERAEAMRENRLNKFLQEMPASDDEAFQSTNISVFSTETIVSYRDRTRPPIGVYGLRGPESLMSGRLSPALSEIDDTQPPFNISYNWGNSYPINFQLIPLKWHGYNNDSGSDKIYLFEPPEDGEIYGIGMDTADGIGKDSTVIEVLRKGSTFRPAAQCLEFTTSKLNALDSLPFAMAIADLFSVPSLSPTGPSERRQCRVAIECKGNGDQVQLKMRLHGWHNFHPWVRIDSKKIAPGQAGKLGVFTNSWFRAGMMEYLITMLRDMEIEIFSPYFVKEMASLEGDEFRQSLKAAYGAHDDRIMALGFILISLIQFDKTNKVCTASAPANLAHSNSLSQRGAAQPNTRMYANYPLSAQEILGSL